MDAPRTQTPGSFLRKRFLSRPTLLSFVLATVVIFLLSTRFNVDWSATWQNVRGINLWVYFLAFSFYYSSFLSRGLRWRMLARNAGFEPSQGVKLPSTLHCSQLILMGWFVNSVTWLRMGDAYRGYAFGRDTKSSISWSLGTILAERVLDMATILGVLLISTLLLTTGWDSQNPIYVLIAALALALVLAALLITMRTYGTQLARFLPGRVEGAYHRFHQGTLGSFKNVPALLGLSLVGWLLEMARLYLVVQSLGLSIDLPLVPIVALGHAILSSVPTPGGLGAVEPGVTGLLLLSMDRHLAVSVALVDRSITYLSVIAIGGLVFFFRHVYLARKNSKENTRETEPFIGAQQ